MAPVGQPILKKGESAKAALAKSKAAHAESDNRLVQSRKWYDGVRANYETRE